MYGKLHDFLFSRADVVIEADGVVFGARRGHLPTGHTHLPDSTKYSCGHTLKYAGPALRLYESHTYLPVCLQEYFVLSGRGVGG